MADQITGIVIKYQFALDALLEEKSHFQPFLINKNMKIYSPEDIPTVEQISPRSRRFSRRHRFLVSDFNHLATVWTHFHTHTHTTTL